MKYCTMGSFVFLLCLFQTLKAQDSITSEVNPLAGIPWIDLMPSKSDTINGISMSWGFGDIDIDHQDVEPVQSCVVVNGVHTYISPIQLFAAVMVVVNLPFALFDKSSAPPNNYKAYLTNQDGEINGCSISLWEWGKEISIKGFQTSLIAHHFESIRGFSIGGIYSRYNSFNGTMISSISNNTDHGEGLQIALFNRAETYQGLQIGLWNRIGKRGLPVINIAF